MIEIRGLAARLGEFELRDVSFDVPDRGYGVVIGPAGSGKTTLLEAIAGVVPSRGGEVRLNGESVTTRPPDERGVGLVYQHGYLFPHLSMVENLR
jgi:ABC-type sugar transport system ATPase subunit